MLIETKSLFLSAVRLFALQPAKKLDIYECNIFFTGTGDFCMGFWRISRALKMNLFAVLAVIASSCFHCGHWCMMLLAETLGQMFAFELMCATVCLRSCPWGIIPLHSCAHQVPYSGPKKIETWETWREGGTFMHMHYIPSWILFCFPVTGKCMQYKKCNINMYKYVHN